MGDRCRIPTGRGMPQPEREDGSQKQAGEQRKCKVDNLKHVIGMLNASSLYAGNCSYTCAGVRPFCISKGTLPPLISGKLACDLLQHRQRAAESR